VPKIIPIYVQQDATLHSLFYLKTALHGSGGTTTHHQERKQLYLQHLVFVTPLLLPAAIAVRYTGRPLTQSNYTRRCINTIVLLRMSTELLETCTGFK